MAFHTSSWNLFTLSFEDLKGDNSQCKVYTQLLLSDFRSSNMQTCSLRFAPHMLLAFPLLLVLNPAEKTRSLILTIQKQKKNKTEISEDSKEHPDVK